MKQTKEAIPEPEAARKQARDYASSAAESAAKTVKDSARPTADRIEKEGIRPAQQAAEALPGKVKVSQACCTACVAPGAREWVFADACLRPGSSCVWRACRWA